MTNFYVHYGACIVTHLAQTDCLFARVENPPRFRDAVALEAIK